MAYRSVEALTMGDVRVQDLGAATLPSKLSDVNPELRDLALGERFVVAGHHCAVLGELEGGSSAPAHPQVLPPAAHRRLMRPGHHARAEAWLLIASL